MLMTHSHSTAIGCVVGVV